jgi:hypothetical protein
MTGSDIEFVMEIGYRRCHAIIAGKLKVEEMQEPGHVSLAEKSCSAVGRSAYLHVNVCSCREVGTNVTVETFKVPRCKSDA